MSDTKSNLHPRNLHRSSYDFAALTEASPELANYVQRNAYGTDSINFSDPNAVKALNRALLKHFMQLKAGMFLKATSAHRFRGVPIMFTIWLICWPKPIKVEFRKVNALPVWMSVLART